MPEMAIATPLKKVAWVEGEERNADVLQEANKLNQIAITIFRHLCKGCEICVEVCPKDVLRMKTASDRWEGAIVEIVDMEACNACMLCEYHCPDFAIEVQSALKDSKAKEKKAVA